MQQNGKVIDMDRVEAIIDKAYASAGYTKTESDGSVVRDDDKMKARAFEVVKEKVVSNPREKSANSVTQGELYAAVFPDAPGADSSEVGDLPPDEYEARSKLVRRAWNLTNPGRQGYVQKRLGSDGSMVLCRSTVMRALDEVKGCYVTDDPQLIVVDSLRPQVEAMVRQANNLARHFEMLDDRHPELQGRMLEELGVGMNKAVAALPEAGGKGAGPKATRQKEGADS